MKKEALEAAKAAYEIERDCIEEMREYFEDVRLGKIKVDGN